MREFLLSAALAINKKAIPQIIPPTIIVVQLPIGNKSDNKNNNNPLPNIKVKTIANATFSGNALILSNIFFSPFNYLNDIVTFIYSLFSYQNYYGALTKYSCFIYVQPFTIYVFILTLIFHFPSKKRFL